MKAANDDTPMPPNPDSDTLAAIKQALAQQEFASIEEVNDFLQTFTKQQNLAGNPDFQGLSPYQMHHLLTRPYDAPDVLVFSTQPSGVEEAPIMRLFQMLVDAIGDKGLKATAMGNLPQKFCREAALRYWGEQEHERRTRYGGINREEDFFDLHVVRIVAEMAKLIRRVKGKFVLTATYRKVLKQGGLSSLYTSLFECYVQKFNWDYRSRGREHPFFQQSFAFTLYLLQQFGRTERPARFYEDRFIQAFPMLLDDLHDAILGAEREIRIQYRYRVLTDFAAFMGLVTLQRLSDDLTPEYAVTALPLVFELVEFR
ncbi:hypothetical protein E3V39_11695 [Gammaproteobacteria bacterium LSUCC0112]|nr:hypothetical protein E3V39_11695 [Gammaproteobacteria bacterium LSUCC0112]